MPFLLNDRVSEACNNPAGAVATVGDLADAHRGDVRLHQQPVVDIVESAFLALSVHAGLDGREVSLSVLAFAV